MAAGKARKARKGTAEGKRLRLVGSEQEQRAGAFGPGTMEWWNGVGWGGKRPKA